MLSLGIKCSHNCITFLQTTSPFLTSILWKTPHGILRSQTKVSDTANELRKQAKFIFQSKEKQSHFRSFFTTPKQFSFSHNQLRFLKVRCAQVLSSVFSKISQRTGQSLFSSKNKSNRSAPTHVTLPNNVWLQQQHENYCFASRIPWRN